MSFLEGAQKISPFTFMGRAIRLPLRLIPNNIVIRVLSGINRGNKWITGAFPTSSTWIGTYEADHTVALKKLVKPGMICYDIGANVGYYTLALSRLVGKSGHVYSFEPEARNVYYLRRHIKLNGIENVTVVQAAVSDTATLVGFSGWRVNAAETRYCIPSITLDDFIRAGNPLPSFVKMDIDGAESTAMDGAALLLSKAKAAWMVATHGPEHWKHCGEVLRRHGYHLVGFDCETDAGEEGDFLALTSDFTPTAHGR